jgi:hypothetical protein
MKTTTRALIIGGGVVGCSVAYHLTKLGWSDVMLLERSELTSGSTWHAAGGFHTLNGDTNMAALQGYTIRLYKELEAITGMSCGLHHVGGVTLADTPERLDMFKAERAKHRFMGLETEIIGPEEIAKIAPVTNVEGVLGGALRPARRPSRPLGHHACLCQGRADGRRGDRASHQGAGDQPPPGRHLGRGDRQGHDPCRTRGQRRRPLGTGSGRTWPGSNCRSTRWNTSTSSPTTSPRSTNAARNIRMSWTPPAKAISGRRGAAFASGSTSRPAALGRGRHALGVRP